MSQDLRKLPGAELAKANSDARAVFWVALKSNWPMSWDEGLAQLEAGRTLDALEREVKRRKAADTRARHQAELAAEPPLAPGQRVEVFSFGRWYPAEVLRVSKVQVHARYTTGTGQRRDKAFPRRKVRALEP